VLKTPNLKNWLCSETKLLPRTWIDNLIRPKQRKRDMRFGKIDLQEVGYGGYGLDRADSG